VKSEKIETGLRLTLCIEDVKRFERYTIIINQINGHGFGLERFTMTYCNQVLARFSQKKNIESDEQSELYTNTLIFCNQIISNLNGTN
jgi:hypothetical protein